MDCKNIEQVNDLLVWLADECPPYIETQDLSHDFAERLRELLDRISTGPYGLHIACEQSKSPTI